MSRVRFKLRGTAFKGRYCPCYASFRHRKQLKMRPTRDPNPSILFLESNGRDPAYRPRYFIAFYRQPSNIRFEAPSLLSVSKSIERLRFYHFEPPSLSVKFSGPFSDKKISSAPYIRMKRFDSNFRYTGFRTQKDVDGERKRLRDNRTDPSRPRQAEDRGSPKGT